MSTLKKWDIYHSFEVYKQVAKERDIAIQQLHELGYGFGQIIEPTTKKDCNTCTHSNETDGSNCYECVKDMCNNYEPTTKNDLGVDAISRQALLNATVKKSSIWNHITNSEGDNLEAIVSKLPSVTPQEAKTENDDLISKEKVIQILRVYSRCGLVTPRIIAEMEHDIKLIK